MNIKANVFRPWRWPVLVISLLAVKLTEPIPPGIWLVNFIIQRILRVNSGYPWMINFTSTVIGKVTIGKDVWKSFALSGGCYIQGGNGIVIGDGTLFAPGVKIISANHDSADSAKWVSCSPVVIGKRCWIGANSVVLPGVVLGDNCVVGAGAVVTSSFPSNCLLVGVPAKVVKTVSVAG